MLEELRTFLKSREPINLMVVFANILVFIVLSFLGNTESARFMASHGACYTPFITESKEYYRLFTAMFLHFGLEHLIYNMLMLIFIGDMIEQLTGKLGYIVIYFGGGLIANLVSMYFDLRKNEYAVSAGASGAIFALLGAMVCMVVINRGILKNNMGKRVILMAVLAIGEGLTQKGIDNVAHIGGFAAGFLLALLFWSRLKLQKSGKNRTKPTLSF